MEFASVRVPADPHAIPVVLSVIHCIADQCGMAAADIDRLSLAAEEAITHIISCAFSDEQNAFFEVAVRVEGMDFIVVLSDKGKPYNYETICRQDPISSASVHLMQNLTDGAVFRNLGLNGHEQHLIKHLVALPQYVRRTADTEQVSPDITFDIHPLRKEEALEVSQCVYDEFGYTYVHDLVYYPDQFYEACVRGEYYSLVATAPDGEVAGHVALALSPYLPGTAEISIGVVKKKFRQFSLMTKLTGELIRIACEELNLTSLNASPVVYHVFTQKIALKMGMAPAAFLLSYLNPDLATSYDDTAYRGSLSWAVRMLTSPDRTVYVPEEADDIVSYVLDLTKSTRTRAVGISPAPDTYSELTIDIDQRLRDGRIFVTKIGSDIAACLKSSHLRLKSERCESTVIFLNLNDPAAPRAYDAAKSLGYFCIGMFPGCDTHDYLLMQNILVSTPDYAGLETIEPFTTLLKKIRELDPNET